MMNIVKFLLMVTIIVELFTMLSHMIVCNEFFKKTTRDAYITFEFYTCTLISALIMAIQVITLRTNSIEAMSFISMIIYFGLILSFQVKISGIKKSEELN